MDGRVKSEMGWEAFLGVIKMVYKKTQPCGWVFEICFLS
jgi:hypothetical protein